jgi:hypothetical protein
VLRLPNPNPNYKKMIYRTVDRIENLEITIKLFRKAEPPILMDELQAKWLQQVTQGLKQDQPTNNFLKKKKKSNLTAERSIYTVVNGDDVENIMNQMQELELSQQFNTPLKINRGMERALQPVTLNETSMLFGEQDQDILGIPVEKPNRWNQSTASSVYSEMKFIARVPERTDAKSEVTYSGSGLESAKAKMVEYPLCKIQYFGNGNFSVTVT